MRYKKLKMKRRKRAVFFYDEKCIVICCKSIKYIKLTILNQKHKSQTNRK